MTNRGILEWCRRSRDWPKKDIAGATHERSRGCGIHETKASEVSYQPVNAKPSFWGSVWVTGGREKAVCRGRPKKEE